MFNTIAFPITHQLTLLILSFLMFFIFIIIVFLYLLDIMYYL